MFVCHPFCDNNKQEQYVSMQLLLTFIIPYIVSDPLRYLLEKKKQCIPLLACLYRFQVRQDRCDSCPYSGICTRFQSRIRVFYSLGLDMVTRITTLVLHTLPKGFICLILLLLPYHLTLFFFCHCAPSAGCTSEHSTQTIYKARLDVSRHSVQCCEPSAEGARTVHWQM